MEKFPPKFSRTLVTPDPHYIPGYGGYCPQLKYHLGKPYGQLTGRLLTSPEVAHSQSLVLHSGHFPSSLTDHSRTAPNTLRDRIPGYTGFVPRSQNYFSKTYSETCRDALHEFQSDQMRRVQLTSEELLPSVNFALPDFKPKDVTTIAVSKDAVTYKPVDAWKPLGSPYLMADSSPYKYFISGFTGYVPKARFLVGTGYPITTNKALIQFGKQRKAGRSGISLTEADNHLPSAPTLYPTHCGMMPSYKGHVPGYKFRYGQTFGQLTNNTLALSGTRREIKSK